MTTTLNSNGKEVVNKAVENFKKNHYNVSVALIDILPTTKVGGFLANQ